MFRLISLFVILALAACIFVQYNDADGFWWMLIYAIVIMVTLLQFWNKHKPFALIGCLGGLVGFVIFMPGWGLDTWILLAKPKDDINQVELVREAVGLLLCSFWLFVLLVSKNKKNAPGENRSV